MTDLPNPVNPLDWRVPIVNSDGTPTVEFQRKWAQQADANGTIPALSTPAEVSALLDIIADTATQILVRGTMEWAGWTPTADSIITASAAGVLTALVVPNAANKFLNGTVPPAFSQVKDTDLSMTAASTANDVSTTEHGFAPILPNDATKYLDGTGNYSVPAGSGGGGAAEMPLVTGDSGPVFMQDANNQPIGAVTPADLRVQAYIGRGTAANRPATPPVAGKATAIYFATDTLATSIWSGTGTTWETLT